MKSWWQFGTSSASYKARKAEMTGLLCKIALVQCVTVKNVYFQQFLIVSQRARSALTSSSWVNQPGG